MSASVGMESEAQTAGKTDGPLTVQVSRSVAVPVTHMWEVLVSPGGAQAFLGEGATLGAKGEPFHCVDGSSGFVRSYHPLEQLRVSWHELPDSPPSIVELDLRSDGAATVLELRHDRILDDVQKVRLEERWASSLDRLAVAAQG